MHDKKNPLRESTCLAALKTALMDEQQVVGLHPHISSARSDALLAESLRPSWLASGPDVAMPKEQALL